MKTRVLKLPTHIESVLPVPTGFPTIDVQMKQEAIQSINWQKNPERHLTQCAFIDAFITLVHQYGYQKLDFYVWKLEIRDRKQLSATIQTLAGVVATDFIIKYTLQMIRDLRHRTNLNRREIGDLLHFKSRHVIHQFLKTYDK